MKVWNFVRPILAGLLQAVRWSVFIFSNRPLVVIALTVGVAFSVVPPEQSFFGFGSSAEVAIELSDAETRKQVEVRNEEGKKEKLFLFYDGETVSGKVSSEIMCRLSLW